MRIAPGAELVPTEQLRSWLSHAGTVPDLTHTAGHVLAFLAAHFAKEGSALVSEETIAGHVHADKSTVVRSIRHLVQRFRDSNHIRRPDRAYRTKCGRRDGG